MKTICIYLMIAVIVLTACSNKTKENNPDCLKTESIYEINLSGDFAGSKCENLLLSDFVEDVEYVQLETTDDCLIGATSFCAFTNTDIYVLNTDFTNERLFRFDRLTGKFIKQIGKTGKGPKDMLKPSALYAENDIVYVSSNNTNKVYVYKKNGEYIQTLSMDKGMGDRIAVVQDKYIISHPGVDYVTVAGNDNHETIGTRYIAAKILDMKGDSLFAQCDTLKGNVILDLNPIRWYYNGDINYYNEIDATIYAANEKGATPRYKFNFGKNLWKITEKLEKEHVEYIKFLEINETSDNLFIYWSQNQKAYFARFNKKTQKLEVQEEVAFKGRFWLLYAYGPKNDIDGCSIYFTPGKSHEDKTGSILFKITPDNIDHIREALEKAENVKFPEKRQQLLKMLDKRKEDDNPILVIYKLKK